uniref:E3 ubiquitin-protein ligase TRIM39-like n=1 Tax=Sinocyclocheilus anshuiensis TaxID=1608454 RepID=A0A671Q744_9TELE
MASSSGPLNEELQCSICMHVLTDPVTTPCGHNFCKTCLNKCWTITQTCFCPLCKETFSRRPAIKINTTLREVVQHFKEKLNQEESELFTDLIRSFERCQSELLKMMEEQQKAAEKQAEDLIKELQQEITELKRRNTELEQLSHTDDHLHLLQMYSTLCSRPHTKNWTEISIDSDVNVYSMHRALTQLKKTHETLNEKLCQTVDVTLDPDTAYPYLILSDDGKQVSDGVIEQDVPENPKRFDDCCVLAKEGFRTGRFYYEVQVEGKSDWNLGVVRESINRKGEISPSPENGFWLLGEVTENLYLVSDNPFVTFFLETPEKVGVFVDYEEGLVSFYDVESSCHIYSFTGQTFTDKLYPYFGPGDNDAGKNSNPLIISPVSSN